MMHFSVLQRLTLLVAIPVVTIVVLVFSSLSSFSTINSGVGRIYDDRLVPLVSLKQINDGYARIINAINKTDNGLWDPDTALTEIELARSVIKDSWSTYLTSNHAEKEKGAIVGLEPMFAAVNTIIQEAVDILATLGKDMRYDEDGETVITNYNGDLFEYVDPIAEQISLLIAIQLDIAKEERQNTQLIYDQAFSWYILLSAFAVCFLVVAGFGLAKSISKPLATICDAIETAVRNYDLTLTLPTLKKDEIGQVAESFQHLMDQFRGVIDDVFDASQTLESYAVELSKSMKVTTVGLDKQSAETEMVAGASLQMSHASEDVSQNAFKAAEAVSSANRQAQEGSCILEKTISVVDAVKVKMDTASEVIDRVAIDSTDIGTVLDVIRGIAEQTNLLALNAAIEAARAGEQGRGFAVVADEVRSLAQRTQESTQTIHEAIERLQSSAKNAVESMRAGTVEMQEVIGQTQRAGDSIAAISAAVSIIHEMNMQTANATEQQMRSSQEMLDNINNIAEATVTSKDTLREVDMAASGLNQTAARLAELVDKFKTG